MFAPHLRYARNRSVANVFKYTEDLLFPLTLGKFHYLWSLIGSLPELVLLAPLRYKISFSGGGCQVPMLFKMGNTWFWFKHLNEWLSLVALLKDQNLVLERQRHSLYLEACPTRLDSHFTTSWTCGAPVTFPLLQRNFLASCARPSEAQVGLTCILITFN